MPHPTFNACCDETMGYPTPIDGELTITATTTQLAELCRNLEHRNLFCCNRASREEMISNIAESARGLFCDTCDADVTTTDAAGTVTLLFAADWHSPWTLQWLTAIAPWTTGDLECGDSHHPFKYVLDAGQVGIAKGQITYGPAQPATLSQVTHARQAA